MKNKRIILLSVILITCFSFAIFTFAKEIATKQEPSKKDDLYEQIELFANTVSIIRSDYVDEVNSKDLIYGALKGMLMSLDSHSQFLDPESYREIKVETEGKFGGIGIELTLKDDILTVITPIEDTPAAKAGLKTNDKIVRINGKSTRDVTLNDAVKELRGSPGSKVVLTILREDEKKLFDVTITRGIIEIKSIKEARILEGNIGYIRLVEFQENTPKDLIKSLQELKVKGMNGLILDLRSNPGGLLDTSIKVSEIFLPRGKVVVSTKGRVKEQNAVYKAGYKKPYTDFPLLVLVNEGSASASEITAGAIKDNKRGLIVGMRTFGKGSVQTVIPLGDGSALRLTTAKYFTPSGKAIHNEGIAPDVVIPFVKEVKNTQKKEAQVEEAEDVFEKLQQEQEQKTPSKEKENPLKYDNQLQRAIDLMKGIKAYESLEARPQ